LHLFFTKYGFLIAVHSSILFTYAENWSVALFWPMLSSITLSSVQLRWFVAMNVASDLADFTKRQHHMAESPLMYPGSW